MSKKKPERIADYKALAALGIARVEVAYDGCGDSGCIDAITAYDAAAVLIEAWPDSNVTIRVRDAAWNEDTQKYEQRFVDKSVPVRDAIEHWCYEILEDHFPGWEIDGGSCGTISIDVKKRRGELEHEARYTDYTLHSVRFS